MKIDYGVVDNFWLIESLVQEFVYGQSHPDYTGLFKALKEEGLGDQAFKIVRQVQEGAW